MALVILLFVPSCPSVPVRIYLPPHSSHSTFAYDIRYSSFSVSLSLSLVFLTFSVSVSICLFPIHRKWFTPQVPSSSLILFDPVHNLLFVGCAKNDLSVCLSRDSNKEPFVRVEGHQRQPNALFASIIFCFGVFLVDTPSFIVNRY